MTETTTTDVRERAVDAAMAVFQQALKLYAPHRHNVEDALDAAFAVLLRDARERLARHLWAEDADRQDLRIELREKMHGFGKNWYAKADELLAVIAGTKEDGRG